MYVLNSLKKYYDDKLLFENDSVLEFKSNGLYIILGKSGSGKSTLLNMLFGFDKDYEGTITFLGKNIKDKHPMNIGYMRQDIKFVSNKNIAWHFANIIGKDKDKVLKKEELLIKFDIKDIEEQYPDELSNGEKKKILFLLLYFRSCSVYLLDEPFADLDNNSIDLMKDLISEISKNSLVILSSHIGIDGLTSVGELIIENRTLNFSGYSDDSEVVKTSRNVLNRLMMGVSIKSIVLKTISFLLVFISICCASISRSSFFESEIIMRDITSAIVNSDHYFSDLEKNKLADVSSNYDVIVGIQKGDFASIKEMSPWRIIDYAPINDVYKKPDFGDIEALQGNEILITDLAAFLLQKYDICSGDDISDIIGCELKNNKDESFIVKGVIRTPGMDVYNKYLEANNTSDKLMIADALYYYSFILYSYDVNRILPNQNRAILIFADAKNKNMARYYDELKNIMELNDENIKLDEQSSLFNDVTYESLSYSLIIIKPFLIAMFSILALAIVVILMFSKSHNIKNKFLLLCTIGYAKNDIQNSFIKEYLFETSLATLLSLILAIGISFLINNIVIFLFVPFIYASIIIVIALIYEFVELINIRRLIKL